MKKPFSSTTSKRLTHKAVALAALLASCIGFVGNWAAAQPAATTNSTVGTSVPNIPPRNLLPLVQPLWSELTPSQTAVLAPMASQWNSYTLADKRSWMKLASGFSKLPADQQQKATARMVEWSNLTPEQRLRVRSNFGIAKKAPQEQRVAEFQQYRAMTPEQRRVLRSAGTTSNTAALYAGARTGLAPEAAQPINKNVAPATGAVAVPSTAPKR